MAGSYGISPVEAGFEVIGLVNCKQIMDYLFVDTRFGQMVILAGCLIAFIQTYKKQDFSFLFYYFTMTLVLWFLFIKPVVSFGDITSTMEKEGLKQTTTKDILENESVESKKLNEGGSLGLVYISRGFNTLVQGTIGAITKATGKEGMSYLKNPFITDKISGYLKEFTASGITKDKVLAEEVQKFLRSCYVRTLTIVSQDTEPEKITRKWWPGHPDIVAKYCVACNDKCKGWWSNPDPKKGIDARLEEYVKQETGVWMVGFNLDAFFTTTTTLKIKLLAPEVARTADNILSDLGSGSNMVERRMGKALKNVGGMVGFGATWLGQFFSGLAAENLIKMLPYIEGFGCMIAYSLFPFTLIICFLWRKVGPLVEYFTTLFWLKSWVIIWALIHYTSIYMAEMQAKLAGGASSDWFIERSYFSMVTSVFLIMSPSIAWFFVKGVLSGIGEISSAATMHADKALGKVKI